MTPEEFGLRPDYVHPDVVQAIADAIRSVRRIPSGHLYAQVMEHLTLEQYEAVVKILVRSKMVYKNTSGLLTWEGDL